MTNIVKFEEVESIEEIFAICKYPKTDYTYSRLSRDRVELAPGQVAVPNMSRRSLSQFRVQGPISTDTTDLSEHVAAKTAWRATAVRKRYTGIDSSDDESAYMNNRAQEADQRWWITRLLVTILTSITTTTANVYKRIVGPSHRYPYTERRPAKANIVSRAVSTLAAPFYWIYTIMKTVITTTVTTVTETITPNHVGETEKYVAQTYKSKEETKRRKAWPWLLLLLLPALGYGLNYTYENYEHLYMPNFTDFHLDLSEFYALEFPTISLPDLNISLSDLNPLPRINLTLPEINITLPDVADNMPEVAKAYREYKDIVQNRMTEASDYLTVVAESCYEEMRRFWRGVIG